MNSIYKRFMVGVLVLWLGIVGVLGASLPAQATDLAGLRIMKQMAQDAVPYEVAIANSKPTLIEFYADWCSVCQSMARTMQTLEGQHHTDINFVMLNVDDPQWGEQIDQYQVTGVPHYVTLDAQANWVETQIGKLPTLVLNQMLVRLNNG